MTDELERVRASNQALLKEHRELKAEIARLRSLTEWQHIETAPKDKDDEG